MIFAIGLRWDATEACVQKVQNTQCLHTPASANISILVHTSNIGKQRWYPRTSINSVDVYMYIEHVFESTLLLKEVPFPRRARPDIGRCFSASVNHSTLEFRIKSALEILRFRKRFNFRSLPDLWGPQPRSNQWNFEVQILRHTIMPLAWNGDSNSLQDVLNSPATGANCSDTLATLAWWPSGNPGSKFSNRYFGGCNHQWQKSLTTSDYTAHQARKVWKSPASCSIWTASMVGMWPTLAMTTAENHECQKMVQKSCKSILLQ